MAPPAPSAPPRCTRPPLPITTATAILLANLLLCLPAPASAQSLETEYSGFSSWVLYGSRAVQREGADSGVELLYPIYDSWSYPSGNYFAAAWAPYFIDSTSTFSVTFDMDIGYFDYFSAPGGGGYAFVIHSDIRGPGAPGEGLYSSFTITPAVVLAVSADYSSGPDGNKLRGQWMIRPLATTGYITNPLSSAVALDTLPAIYPDWAANPGPIPEDWPGPRRTTTRFTVTYTRESNTLTASTAMGSVSATVDLASALNAAQRPVLFGFTAGKFDGQGGWNTVARSFAFTGKLRPPLSFPYEYTGLSGWTTLGSAALGSSGSSTGVALTLTTPDTAEQIGAAWSPTCVLGSLPSFSASFVVTVSGSTLTLPNGKDNSWAFVLQADPRGRQAIAPAGGDVIGWRNPQGGFSMYPSIAFVVTARSPGIYGQPGLYGGWSFYERSVNYGDQQEPVYVGPVPWPSEAAGTDSSSSATSSMAYTITYDALTRVITATSGTGITVAWTLASNSLQQLMTASSAVFGFTGGSGSGTSKVYGFTISDVSIASSAALDCSQATPTPASPPSPPTYGPVVPPPPYGGSGGSGGGGSGGGTAGSGSTAVSIRWDLLLGFGKLLLTFLEQLWKTVTAGPAAGRGL